MAQDVPLDRQTFGRHRLLPAAQVEVLAPLLERAAARHTRSTTRPTRRSPRLASPSTSEAAGSCHLSCTPRALWVASRSNWIFRRISAMVFWPNHWNGVCAFGTNPPTDTVTEARLVPLPEGDALTRQLGDAQRVLVGLGGQPGQEVELHPAPPLAVCGVDRAVEVLLRDQLVDDGTKAPGAGLGANVSPERRARATWAAMPTVKASTPTTAG